MTTEEATRKIDSKKRLKKTTKKRGQGIAHTAEYKTLCHSEQEGKEREREMLLVTLPDDTCTRIRFVMRR